MQMNRTHWLLVAFLAIVALMMALQPAQAATVTADLTWTQPETRTDGTPLSADEIAGYRIYQAIDGHVSDNPESEYIAVTQDQARAVEIQLDPRPEPYTIRFGVRAVDTQGRYSDLSNIVSQQFLVSSTSAPGAPTSLRLQISCASGCTITVLE